MDLVARRVEVRYTDDWRPIELVVDATLRGQPLSIQTNVTGGTAQTHLVNSGQSSDKTDQIPADAALLPSPFWGPFEALAQRLRTASPGSTISAYGGTAVFTIRVNGETQRIASHTVLWAAGVKPSPLGAILASRAGAPLDKAGRVIVEPDLSVPGHPEILVVGDLANFSHQTGQPLPGVAPVAIQQAKAAINAGIDMDLENGCRFENEAFALTFATADKVEGMKAFLEKRAANFKGE